MPKKGRIKNILVVRNDRFGEFLLNIPAIRALKETFPDVKIILAVSLEVKELASTVEYTDQVVVWDDDFRKSLGQYRFDACVVLNPSKEAHLASFQKVDVLRERGLKDLAGLSRITERLKPFIYNDNLRRLEEQKQKYQEKVSSLAGYCQYLKQAAETRGLSLQDYPQVAFFVEMAQMEKEIDFKAAEFQRNAFIRELSGLLDKDGVRVLTEKSQEFKDKRITPQEYYSFLNSIAKEKIDLKENYPQFQGYMNYIVTSKEINTKGLLEEMGEMEEKIREASFANADERKLAEISRSIQVLGKIFNLELTPEDYAYFQAHKSDFITAGWIEFLAQNCRKYNIALRPEHSQIIDENFAQLEEFYRIGTEREQAFMKNIFRKMDESGEKLAVLITGGFHTPGITRLLKEKGYAYVVAAPVITQKSDSNLYFSVLRGEFNQPGETLR